MDRFLIVYKLIPTKQLIFFHHLIKKDGGGRSFVIDMIIIKKELFLFRIQSKIEQYSIIFHVFRVRQLKCILDR